MQMYRATRELHMQEYIVALHIEYVECVEIVEMTCIRHVKY